MASKVGSVDLHSHTVYSDGTKSPVELVRLARLNGVQALSVTDHDHTGAIEEALTTGIEEGVEIIPGIELSATHLEFEDIHILGYYFAWQLPQIQSKLTAFRAAREARGERILERINAMLLREGRNSIPYEVVKGRVKGAFGRPHIATLLVERGYAADINAAFREYLTPCNVPKLFFSASEALTLIHAARGLAVVAHPFVMTPDRKRLYEVLSSLKALGLDGIEVFRNDHDPEAQHYLSQLAAQLSMIGTGGSDYHGIPATRVHRYEGRSLGEPATPYHIAVRLRQEYLARYPIALLLLDWTPQAAASLRRALLASYSLPPATDPPTSPPIPGQLRWRMLQQSQVLYLAAADRARIDALVAEGEELGVRVVGVPWHTSKLAGYAGLPQTAVISPERFQHTPVERLAHAIVHTVILAQSRGSRIE